MKKSSTTKVGRNLYSEVVRDLKRGRRELMVMCGRFVIDVLVVEFQAKQDQCQAGFLLEALRISS